MVVGPHQGVLTDQPLQVPRPRGIHQPQRLRAAGADPLLGRRGGRARRDHRLHHPPEDLLADLLHPPFDPRQIGRAQLPRRQAQHRPELVGQVLYTSGGQGRSVHRYPPGALGC